MYYNIKIITKDSQLALESTDKAIIEREMDIYFVRIFGASEEFKSRIKEIKINNPKTQPTQNQTIANTMQANSFIQNSNIDSINPNLQKNTILNQNSAHKQNINTTTIQTGSIINTHNTNIDNQQNINDVFSGETYQQQAPEIKPSIPSENKELEKAAQELFEQLQDEVNKQRSPEDLLKEAQKLDIIASQKENNQSNVQTEKISRTEKASDADSEQIQHQSENTDQEFQILPLTSEDITATSTEQTEAPAEQIQQDEPALGIYLQEINQEKQTQNPQLQSQKMQSPEQGMQMEALIQQENDTQKNSRIDNLSADFIDALDIDSDVTTTDEDEKLISFQALQEMENDNKQETTPKRHATRIFAENTDYKSPYNDIVNVYKERGLYGESKTESQPEPEISTPSEKPDVIIENEEADDNKTEKTSESEKDEMNNSAEEGKTQDIKLNEEFIKEIPNITFDRFLATFSADEIHDEFLICAAFLKNILKQFDFTMKAINANLFQTTGKIADTTIVDELIQKEYIKTIVVDDFTKYTITPKGEAYLANKLAN